MPQPFDLPLPPNLYLSGGYTVRVTAIDPTSGAVVSGVNVSDVTLQVEQIAGGDLASGPFMLVPGPSA